MHQLLAISPLDGRYHQKLTALAPIVSEYGLIHYRFITELQWLRHLVSVDALGLPVQDRTQVQKRLAAYQQQFDAGFAERVKACEHQTAHDVKALEYTIAEDFKTDALLKPLIPWIHFGCTSDDINNTAYALMLKDALSACVLPALDAAIQSLMCLAKDSQAMPMLSHTHGQPASPTTMGKELTNFVVRLEALAGKLAKVPIVAKFNGAVGNYNAHHVVYPEVDWPAQSQAFIESLGVVWQSHSTQVNTGDDFAHSMHLLAEMMTVVIDLTRDCWLYISMQYFQQKSQKEEVGSSTMPHKINPIHFENAEGNAELARALCSFMADKMPISRLQRDLSGSTVMRHLGSVLASVLLSLTSLASGLSRLEPNADKMRADCAQVFELLAEPIQMMMRRYGIADAYDQLKALTRGEQGVTQEAITAFIQSTSLPQAAKARLLDLLPETYTGYAQKLVLTPAQRTDN